MHLGVDLDPAVTARGADRLKTAHRHDAGVAVVELVGLPTLQPQGFGQLVGLYGGLGQFALGRLAAFDLADSLRLDVYVSLEGRHLHRVLARTVQQTVRDFLVHLHHQRIEPLRRGQFVADQRVGCQEGVAHRPFFFLFVSAGEDVLLDLPPAGQRLVGGFSVANLEALRVRSLHLAKRLLGVGIVAAVEIAHHHGDLVEIVDPVTHPDRRAGRIESPAVRAAELEALAVGVCLELVSPAKLQDEFSGLLLSRLAGKRAGHDHPRPVLFGQRIRLVGIGVHPIEGKEITPRRLCVDHRGPDQSQDQTERQPASNLLPAHDQLL